MSTTALSTAESLFEDALDWLRAYYGRYRFFAERDIVWTLQLRLLEMVAERQLDLTVWNDYPMPECTRADLVLLSSAGAVEVAAEFKYEPSHRRTDIRRTKLPVAFWDKDGVGKDVQRVGMFVAAGKARTAYAIFIDEGGAFRDRPPHTGSTWVDWVTEGPSWLNPSVLWTRVSVENNKFRPQRRMGRALGRILIGLAAWRKSTGLTQIQAAERLGVCIPAYIAWEQGKRCGLTEADLLKRISRVNGLELGLELRLELRDLAGFLAVLEASDRKASERTTAAQHPPEPLP